MKGKVPRIRIPRLKKKYNIYELGFLLTYFLFGYTYIINVSMYKLVFATGRLYKIVCAFSVILLFLLYFSKKHIQKKTFFISILLGAILIASFITTKSFYVAIVAAFVLCSDFVPFEKIVKVSIFTTLIGMSTVFLGYFTGILPDYMYHEHHSYGFSYYSTIAFLIFFMWMGYIYLRNKQLSIIELLLWGLFHYAVYKVVGVRLVFFLALIILAMYLIVAKWKWFDIKNRVFLTISKIGFPVCAIASIWASINYSSSNAIWIMLNGFLSNRLSQGRLAFDQYCVKLFGQYIVMQGNSYWNSSSNSILSSQGYFYIDSGYVYALLGYGVAFLLAMLCVYIFLYNYAAEKQNPVLWLWITSIMIFSLINDCWLNITYNPIFLMFIPAIREYNGYRKIHNVLKNEKERSKDVNTNR